MRVVPAAAALTAAVAAASAGAAPATFPGKPGRILFHSDRGAHTDLFALPSRGGRATRLTKADEFDDYWAEWSPSGRLIAFTRRREGADAVYVMDAKGRRQRRLAAGWDPSWSADGSRIAFAYHAAGGDTEIYSVPVRGGRPVNLTNNGATDVAPAWSPDGKQIAFASDRGRMPHDLRLWIMSADGSRARPLGPGSVPSWSPGGKRLVFLGGTRDDIFVVGANGTGLRRLTRGLDAEGPVWSPDGRWIAFARSIGGEAADVYVMDAGGKRLRRVTDDIYDDHSPSWQRVR